MVDGLFGIGLAENGLGWDGCLLLLYGILVVGLGIMVVVYYLELAWLKTSDWSFVYPKPVFFLIFQIFFTELMVFTLW